MKADNSSYHSFTPPPRGVDVNDLRAALGHGHLDSSLTTSSPPSVVSSTAPASSLHSSTVAGKFSRKEPLDVKEVLKEIFKDKDRRRGRRKGSAGLGPTGRLGGNVNVPMVQIGSKGLTNGQAVA